MRYFGRISGLWFFVGCIAVSLPLSAQTQVEQSAPATVPAAPDTTQASPTTAQTQPAATPDAVQPPVQHTGTPLSASAYEYLLDVLFPFDHAAPPSVDYVMVLRFEPHVHPELQIVIRKLHNGKIDATISQVATGNAWFAAYQQLVPGESPNFQAIAANIRLRDNRFNLDSQQLEAWHKDVFPVLAKEEAKVKRVDKELQRKGKHGEHEVGTVGTRYEFWFIQANDEEHMIAWDSESEDVQTGSSALTQWMNKVRIYATGAIPPKAGPTRPGIAHALPMTQAPVVTAPEVTETTQPAMVGTAVQPAAAPAAMQPEASIPAQPAATMMPQPTTAQAAVQPAASNVANPVFPQPGHPETYSTASKPALHLAPATSTQAQVSTMPAMPPTQAASSAPPQPTRTGTTLNPVFPQPGHPETYAATPSNSTAQPLHLAPAPR